MSYTPHHRPQLFLLPLQAHYGSQIGFHCGIPVTQAMAFSVPKRPDNDGTPRIHALGLARAADPKIHIPRNQSEVRFDVSEKPRLTKRQMRGGPTNAQLHERSVIGGYASYMVRWQSRKQGRLRCRHVKPKNTTATNPA